MTVDVIVPLPAVEPAVVTVAVAPFMLPPTFESVPETVAVIAVPAGTLVADNPNEAVGATAATVILLVVDWIRLPLLSQEFTATTCEPGARETYISMFAPFSTGPTWL